MQRLIVLSPVELAIKKSGSRSRILQIADLLSQRFHRDVVIWSPDSSLDIAAFGGLFEGRQVVHEPAPELAKMRPRLFQPSSSVRRHSASAVAVGLENRTEINAEDIVLIAYPTVMAIADFLSRSPKIVLDVHDYLPNRRWGPLPIPDMGNISVSANLQLLGRAGVIITHSLNDYESLLNAGFETKKVVMIPHFPASNQSVRGRDEEFVTSHASSRTFSTVGLVMAPNLQNVISTVFLFVFFLFRFRGRPPFLLKLAGDVSPIVTGVIRAAFFRRSNAFRYCGLVPSIADFYNGVDVSINPVLFSSGASIRVTESLVHGVPILARRQVWKGIVADPPAAMVYRSFSSLSIELARSPEDWAPTRDSLPELRAEIRLQVDQGITELEDVLAIR